MDKVDDVGKRDWREELVQAELEGVQQHRGHFYNEDFTKFCALGALARHYISSSRGSVFINALSIANTIYDLYGLSPDRMINIKCPVCGITRPPHIENSKSKYKSDITFTELSFIVHLNDDHNWSFLDI